MTHRPAASPRRAQLTALVLTGVVAGMLGLSFAAVPLYRMFCQVTGYGGTTQRAEQAPESTLERSIVVRFDGNVSNGMPWRFRPVQNQMVVKLGESALAHFQATNLSARAITGTASFNVTPEIAGSYFNKIECFCFTEQRLEPGQTVDMPVTFFVDPKIVDDPDAFDIREITLSYTFFPVRERAPSLAGAASGGGGS